MSAPRYAWLFACGLVFGSAVGATAALVVDALASWGLA